LHPYAKGLMDSILVPEEGARQVLLCAIPGTSPNLKNPPPGCRFAPRCCYAVPVCTEKEQTFNQSEEGRAYRCWRAPDELRGYYADGHQ